jgi:hypothetical protein
MRILLAFCICFHLAQCSAQAQEAVGSPGSRRPAPQQTAPQSTVPPVPQQGVPQQGAPQRGSTQQAAPQPGATQPGATQPGATQPGATQPGATQQAAPQSDPFKDDPAPSQPDNLDLDSNRAFNFNDSADTPFSNPSDFQSSVASNSNFSGASPQMIGDFGGGSSILTLGAGVGAVPINGTGAWSNMLTTPIPLAGGSRRIKIAENNQVMPTDRWYGTVNYFHNSYQAIGTEGNNASYPVSVVDSESLVQYTAGFEKTFCLWGSPFSFDVRMPFTGGVNQSVDSYGAAGDSYLNTATGEMGNVSTTLKAYLLEFKQISISGGLGMSLPTGSDTNVGAGEYIDQEFVEYTIDIDNNAVHLMPFLGAYRQIGNSCWLQAFTQIDMPTNGNDVRVVETRYNGTDYIDTVRGDSLNEQTLLYADVSFGKWWYRNICECGEPRCRGGRRGLTGLASILELHYTSSLNDADAFNLGGIPRRGAENRFDILNMTTGLQVELNQELRINLAGVFPLRDGRFDGGGRREDRGFDHEFALQVNYLY